MAIILDANDILASTYGGYLEKALYDALVRAWPGQRFILPAAIGPGNVLVAEIPPQKGLFHQKKTRNWLQQQNAEAFVSFNRILNIALPLKQVLLIAGEERLNDASSIAAATAIGIATPGLNRLFEERYPAYKEKSFSIEGLASGQLPAETEPPADINGLVSGKAYFINADFNHTRDGLVGLLKGFSKFKRRLQSNWKLVIALRPSPYLIFKEAEDLLSNYKYREDVVLTGAENLSQKLAGAYAAISIASGENVPVAIAEAVAVQTPVIAFDTYTVKEWLGDRVLCTTGNSSDAIAEALMRLYKEELFRRSLIEKMKDNPALPRLEQAVGQLKAVLK